MTQPIGTPDALSSDISGEQVIQAQQSITPKGLQKRFQYGEQLPWKGVWFEIDQVTPDAILLKPIGETWKHYKGRTGR